MYKRINTGGIVRKVKLSKDQSSAHIFLYIGVICLPEENSGQLSVVQMLSERHDTNAITY